METFKLAADYELIDCINCGCSFALKKSFLNDLRRTGANFYCPSTFGHSMSYPKAPPKPPPPLRIEYRERIVNEEVTEHSHRFGRGKKPQCKICGLYKHMLRVA